jgi:hypothetical protein
MINNKILTVRDLINGSKEGFDPMDIDLTEIKSLSDALPKDGNIEANNAEVLATKYLRGVDLCSELLAIAIAYAQKTDTLKKKAYSEAALVKSQNAGIKTDKSKAWFAEMDDDYINASNKHSEALAFARWVQSKHSSFEKMHYMCKKILERSYNHEKMSGFHGTIHDEKEQDDFGSGW